MSVLEVLSEHGVVPVVEVDDEDSAVPLARALIAAGLPCLEVTRRPAPTRDAVRSIAEVVPEMQVGAGTIITPDQIAEAKRAGAKFCVSPAAENDVLDAASDAGMPYIPGVATPADIVRCLRAGFTRLKLFPAGVIGGPDAVSALAGPFPECRFMPTGGVREPIAAQYLQLSTVFAVGGTWIAPRADIAARSWTEITARARAAVEIVSSVRGSAR